MRDSEKKLNNKGSKKSGPLKVRKKGQGKKEKVKVGSKFHTKNAGTDTSRKRVISSLKVKGPPSSSWSSRSASEYHFYKNSRLPKQENVNPLKSKPSKITMTHSQKDVKNVNGRKKMKSYNKKRQLEIPPPPGENGNKDFMEISDDMCLKKLLKKRKKRLINFTFGGDSQVEFERLSELKTKADSMNNCNSKLQS